MDDNAYNVLIKIHELMEKYDKFTEKEHSYVLGLVVALLEIYKEQQEEKPKGIKFKF